MAFVYSDRKYKITHAHTQKTVMTLHVTVFIHFLPSLPQCVKQAPVNNMNNAVLLRSPAEARQAA